MIETPAPASRSTTWPVAASAERHPGRTVALATLVVGLPLVVAVVALRGERWYPVLDLAMTELRVRDVFGPHTPLIGLPGRIGTYPDQGSHPGPLGFWLLAPAYRLVGATAWGMELATVVVHLAAVATSLWIGSRRLGWRGVAAVAVLLALVIRGFGQVPLTQPWNPYLPLLAWVVVLLAAWSVLCGDHVMAIPLVVAASYCAQTHVPYLGLGAGMVALGAVALAVQARHADRPGRLAIVRSAGIAVAAGVVLWSAPVVDQLVNEPGNLRRLADHFGTPPESPLGVADGGELAVRHLDVAGGFARQVATTGTFLDATSAWRGALTVVAWAVLAATTWRRAPAALRALHVVVATGLLLGLVSMTRIFGRPWFYLTLWAWAVTAVLVGALLWSVAIATRRRADVPADRPPDVRARPAGPVAVVAAGFAAVVSIASAVAFAAAEHPEERLSEAVGALAAPTYAAVVDGVGAAPGADGRYLVRWSDAADIGSPGYGLLLELERRGLDVAADETFRVQVTEHRTRRRADADAQLHLATGGHVERWRAVADAVEVASHDPRSDAERAEYAEVRAALVDRLAVEGLGDLVPLVDENLFGLSVDQRLSAADHADLGRLIELGQPMAVFVAPPPADDDPTAL